MTDSKRYNVAGAEVEITITGYVDSMAVHITLDLNPLDLDEPDHSPHRLINYVSLRNYTTRKTYWWRKLHRSVTVKSSSQARRVVKNALTLIDDAVSTAILKRDMRKTEIDSVLSF